MGNGTVNLRAVSDATVKFDGTCWRQVAILDRLDTTLLAQFQAFEYVADIYSLQLELLASALWLASALSQFQLFPKRGVGLQVDTATLIG